MNLFQRTVGATAMIGVLSGCGDPINNNQTFSQWTPEQTRSILGASSVSELVKIPDLEKNIRKWVRSPYSEWNMQVMQALKGGIAGVEQNATVSIKFGEVKEGTYSARFTNPKDRKEYKDFAIVCANGMMKGMNNLSFSTPVSIPTQITNASPIISSTSSSTTPNQTTVYKIKSGDTLMGTLGLSKAESRDVAKKYGFPEAHRKGKYIVDIQPGTTFKIVKKKTGEKVVEKIQYVPSNAMGPTISRTNPR